MVAVQGVTVRRVNDPVRARQPRAWVEIAGLPELFFNSERVTVGRTGTDIELADTSVSRLHAVFERVSTGWIVHDLGSTYGTTLNGVRATGARVVHDGDVLTFGATSLTFRCWDTSEVLLTAPPPEMPRVTARERDLLVALCRPVLNGDMLAEPASVRAMSAELVVSESAVKKLLTRIYDKFGLTDERRRRGYLAAEALRRGVVTSRDV